ncbi:CYFA0S15e01222g1_1 [Cyberlindnera fabianii]|uniref:CYFA0S15e01222g1_1 n=1 Tax=Cyberlindnera fabianii TaxID=36022 RepID=A0A061BCI4_CYBFA|nr:CYFA0S15e01222g1_1 [Cyberlindnera fabianii]
MSKILKLLEVPHPPSHPPSFLLNRDLEPIPPHKRQWGFFSNFCYWGVISFNMGTWLSSSSSLSLGLSIGGIFAGYILGDLVTIAYTILNSFPGLDWHVGYTVTQRVSFGIYGSGLGILVRVLLSIVNYGSGCYIGGQAVSLVLSAWSKSYMNLGDNHLSRVAMTERDLAGFLIFHVFNAICAFMPPYRFNRPLIVSCVCVFFAMLGMVIHLQIKAGGYGDVFGLKTTLSSSEQGWMIIYVMTYWFSSVSPGTQNQCDYSRFATSTTSVVLGTFLSLLIPTTVIPLFGIIGASTTSQLYGEELWIPTDIVLRWLHDSYTPGTRCAASFIGFTFVASQVCLNSINCGFSSGMDLAGILPRYINVTRGFLLTAAVSFAVQPWNFYNTSSVFLTVMSSFGVVTTPIIAICVCDYLVIRRRVYKISEAFVLNGEYYYTGGINFRAVVAFIVGMTPGLPGMAWQVDQSYFNNRGIVNFFYGDSLFAFVIPFACYWILCLIWPINNNVFTTDEEDVFGCFTEKEKLEKGICSAQVDEISMHSKNSRQEI